MAMVLPVAGIRAPFVHLHSNRGPSLAKFQPAAWDDTAQSDRAALYGDEQLRRRIGQALRSTA